MIGRVRFALICVAVRVFGREGRGGPMHEIARSFQVGERDKALLKCILVGASGMDFFSVMPEEKPFRAVFCGGFDGDGHLFWECPHLLGFKMCENPEFHDLIQRDLALVLVRSWLACCSFFGS